MKRTLLTFLTLAVVVFAPLAYVHAGTIGDSYDYESCMAIAGNDAAYCAEVWGAPSGTPNTNPANGPTDYASCIEQGNSDAQCVAMGFTNPNAGSGGDSICRAYGPGTGCTTSSGASGTCDSSNVCVVSGAADCTIDSDCPSATPHCNTTTYKCQASAGTSSGGDSICRAYGPGTGCTTSSGASGTCDSSNVCVASGAGTYAYETPSSGSGTYTYQTPSSGAGGTGLNVNVLKPYGTSILFIINQVMVPILFAVAFITFLYGVAKKYIFARGDEAAVEEGHKLILWGVIGFVVMISIWGLVNVVNDTLGLSTNNTLHNLPQTPTTP